jgi:hypothetical protein
MVRKNKGWRGILVDRKYAAIFLEKNLKNSKLPTLFYLHFTNNGYINVCVA